MNIPKKDEVLRQVMPVNICHLCLDALLDTNLRFKELHIFFEQDK
jgi:hypothetical protein